MQKNEVKLNTYTKLFHNKRICKKEGTRFYAELFLQNFPTEQAPEHIDIFQTTFLVKP